jgi:cell division protein ZapA (FtsZ GTPase activity inhibitor)
VGSASQAQTTAIKILGKEYKLRTDADPQHLQDVAAYVDRVLLEVRSTAPDTQDAAILAALNIASELMLARELPSVRRERIQALIDLVDSA